jgi:hypothetical protein
VDKLGIESMYLNKMKARYFKPLDDILTTEKMSTFL